MVSFNVLSLFASGEQGVWYDPSDFSTMFQDSAGTTPVTAVEQPVGLILDKSKGLALGGELVSNGTFDTNLTGWSNNGTVSSSWTSNGASVTRNASGDLIYQAVSCTVGRTYLVSAEVKSGTLARVGFNSAIVGGSGEVTLAGGVGTYTARLAATATTMYVLLGCAANASTAVFDNISVKEISGNHASQSTTTSRPVLSARVNLLTYSEQFDNAAWTKGQATISSNSVLAPTGIQTADSIIDTAINDLHRAYQSIASLSPAGKTYTVSVHAKANTLGFVTVGVTDISSGSLYAAAVFNLSTGALATSGSAGVGYSVASTSISSAGNGWFRCSVTCVVGSSASFLTAFIGISKTGAITAGSGGAEVYLGDGAGGIYIWGADLRVTNDGVGIPTYQRIAAATDYDTTGFPYYLRFDGTDDSLATGAVNFSVTDKVSVFAGIRKLADGATAGALVELTASSSVNNGAFAVFAPGAASVPTFLWRSKGTVNASSSTASSYPAPITAVLTGTGDIANDAAKLRYNGTLVLDITTDQGTGAFSNDVIYIGRRGGSSLPFNGHLYSLIVRGAASSDEQIASAEAWTNTKTRAY